MSPRRRQFLRGVAAMAGTLAVTGCVHTFVPRSASFESGPATADLSPTRPTDERWPMEGYDAGSTRHAAAVTAPTPPLERAWTVDAAAFVQAATADRLFATGGPHDGLVAFTRDTREPVWSVGRAEGVRVSHCVLAGDTVVAGVTRATGDGYEDALVGFAASDGTERWRRDGLDARDSPVVVGATVYVPAGYAVEAVDATTGERCFRYTFADPTFRVGGLAVGNGRVYAGTVGMETDYPDAGRVVALDPTAGEVAWSDDPGLPVRYVGCAGDRVVAAVDGLRAYGASSGGEQWSAGRGISGGVAITDRHVVTTDDTSVDDLVVAYDLASGEERWRTELDVEMSGNRPVVAGGHVYFAAGGHGGTRVVALDVATGEERWRTRFVGSREVLVSAGHLVVSTRQRFAGFA